MKKPATAHDLVYTDIGHERKAERIRESVIPFYLARGEDDIVYLEPGQTHSDSPFGDYRYSDILGRVVKSEKRIAVAAVLRVDQKKQQQRLDYAVSILAMDWPGYEIWYFGSGGEHRHGTRLKNPAPSGDFVLLGTCVTVGTARSITAMVDSGREISRKTFLRWVDRDEMKSIEQQLGYDRHLPMANEPYVMYYKGQFMGVPAVWFDWSAIVHIFVAPEHAYGEISRG